MKFRVHSFQVVRVTYEVEANSTIEAKGMVYHDEGTMTPIEVGDIPSEDWTENFIVDPILPNGEVDYDNVTNFSGDVTYNGEKEPAPPKVPMNYLGLKGWAVKASKDGEYLYIQRLGKPGEINIKAEDEGLLVDIWNTPHDDAPECMDSMMVAYSDLEEFSEGDILGDSGTETLPQWRVTLYTGASKSEVIHFECWATDSMHAQELALMSWPKGEIIQYEVIN